MYLFLILPSMADRAAVKPNGANTFLANSIATFINGPANLLNNLPKKFMRKFISVKIFNA